jgi:hypothetical protein
MSEKILKWEESEGERPFTLSWKCGWKYLVPFFALGGAFFILDSDPLTDVDCILNI